MAKDLFGIDQEAERYAAFTKKFEGKKTTDDCYTPPEVYTVVKRWVERECGSLEGVRVMRPFYPGGSYVREDYSGNCAVIDNPPFSILAQIVRFYTARGVRFFLFAPALTLFNYGNVEGVTCITCGATVTYDNGAKVPTSFLTNMLPGDYAFILAGDLCKDIEAAQKAVAQDNSYRRIKYPPEVVNAAILQKVSKRGVCWRVKRSSCRFIRKMDCGQSLFGAGFLLSEGEAKEREAKEREAKEREAARRVCYYELSDRERRLSKSLE